MTNSIDVLKNAFTNLKQYNNSTFVIKCDGEVLENEELLSAFAEDVAAIKNAGINVIIVHDGTNIVNSVISKFSIKSNFANISSADQTNVEMVEMVLVGHVNQKIVAKLNSAGVNAIGISGKDSNFLVAKRAKLARFENNSDSKILQFGFLGELALINPDILLSFEDSNFIPVIAPTALGEDKRTYKIDPNDIAGAIAAIMSAYKLIFITNSSGITDSNGKLIDELTFDLAKKISQEEGRDAQTTSQLRAGVMAYEQSTEMVHIIDGKIPHALMLDLFTNQNVGTKIK